MSQVIELSFGTFCILYSPQNGPPKWFLPSLHVNPEMISN